MILTTITSSRLAGSRRGWMTVLVWAALLVQAPAPVEACACCAERGTWYQESRRITPEELAEIGRVNLDAEARTYVTAAGLEEIQGISSPADVYAIRRLDRPSRRWRLELTDPSGKQGRLAFEIPDRGTFFAADLQGDDAVLNGSPQLYKELRLTGSISGSGTFKGGTFRLVFQGRGNACPNGADFQSWILQVTGPGVNYSLFGRMTAATPRPGA